MGFDVDLAAAVDSGSADGLSDAGIPCGAELLRFASAAQSETSDLPSARAALRDVLGQDAVIEAAATVAIFNGLVRVADGTGIQLDAGLASASATSRVELGLDAFAGAANTPLRASSGPADQRIARLFGS